MTSLSLDDSNSWFPFQSLYNSIALELGGPPEPEVKQKNRIQRFKPGEPLSPALRKALGVKSRLLPPPWLGNMQRYGPPPSYPDMDICGLNSPLPHNSCKYGYHSGGWGYPSVDGFGTPVYGGNPFDEPCVPRKEAYLFATQIQSLVKCFLIRCRFLKKRKAATTIQALGRGYLHRRRYLEIRCWVIVIQAYVRRHFDRHRCLRKLENIITVQSCARRFLVLRSATVRKAREAKSEQKQLVRDAARISVRKFMKKFRRRQDREERKKRKMAQNDEEEEVLLAEDSVLCQTLDASHFCPEDSALTRILDNDNFCIDDNVFCRVLDAVENVKANEEEEDEEGEHSTTEMEPVKEPETEKVAKGFKEEVEVVDSGGFCGIFHRAIFCGVLDEWDRKPGVAQKASAANSPQLSRCQSNELSDAENQGNEESVKKIKQRRSYDDPDEVIVEMSAECIHIDNAPAAATVQAQDTQVPSALFEDQKQVQVHLDATPNPVNVNATVTRANKASDEGESVETVKATVTPGSNASVEDSPKRVTWSMNCMPCGDEAMVTDEKLTSPSQKQVIPIKDEEVKVDREGVTMEATDSTVAADNTNLESNPIINKPELASEPLKCDSLMDVLTNSTEPSDDHGGAPDPIDQPGVSNSQPPAVQNLSKDNEANGIALVVETVESDDEVVESSAPESIEKSTKGDIITSEASPTDVESNDVVHSGVEKPPEVFVNSIRTDFLSGDEQSKGIDMLAADVLGAAELALKFTQSADDSIERTRTSPAPIDVETGSMGTTVKLNDLELHNSLGFKPPVGLKVDPDGEKATFTTFVEKARAENGNQWYKGTDFGPSSSPESLGANVALAEGPNDTIATSVLSSSAAPNPAILMDSAADRLKKQIESLTAVRAEIDDVLRISGRVVYNGRQSTTTHQHSYTAFQPVTIPPANLIDRSMKQRLKIDDETLSSQASPEISQKNEPEVEEAKETKGSETDPLVESILESCRQQAAEGSRFPRAPNVENVLGSSARSLQYLIRQKHEQQTKLHGSSWSNGSKSGDSTTAPTSLEPSIGCSVGGGVKQDCFADEVLEAKEKFLFPQVNIALAPAVGENIQKAEDEKSQQPAITTLPQGNDAIAPTQAVANAVLGTTITQLPQVNYAVALSKAVERADAGKSFSTAVTQVSNPFTLVARADFDSAKEGDADKLSPTAVITPVMNRTGAGATTVPKNSYKSRASYLLALAYAKKQQNGLTGSSMHERISTC